MSRRQKQHWHELPDLLKRYANSRKLQYKSFDQYHYRLEDEDFTAIDIWTTRKYQVIKTRYCKITNKRIIERTGERGMVPGDKVELGRFLDRLFWAADILNEQGG